jgi:hypothetical protein
MNLLTEHDMYIKAKCKECGELSKMLVTKMIYNDCMSEIEIDGVCIRCDTTNLIVEEV